MLNIVWQLLLNVGAFPVSLCEDLVLYGDGVMGWASEGDWDVREG